MASAERNLGDLLNGKRAQRVFRIGKRAALQSTNPGIAKNIVFA
jgi:hypothetical protein